MEDRRAGQFAGKVAVVAGGTQVGQRGHGSAVLRVWPCRFGGHRTERRARRDRAIAFLASEGSRLMTGAGVESDKVVIGVHE